MKRFFKKLQYQCRYEVYNLEYQLKCNLKCVVVIQQKTRSQEISGWKLVH